jgi:hypothetical protein
MRGYGAFVFHLSQFTHHRAPLHLVKGPSAHVALVTKDDDDDDIDDPEV